MPAPNAPPAAVVENRLFDLHLDQLAFFLDHDDQVQPLGPVVKPAHVQRESLPHLICGHPQTLGLGLVNIQQRQRMHQIQPVLACGHKSDLGTRFAPDAFVHFIGMGKGLGGETLVVNHPRFLLCRGVQQANVQPALGHVEIGDDQVHPVGATIDNGGGLDRVLHGFQPDPQPGKP